MSYRYRNVIIGVAFIAVLIVFSSAFWQKKEKIEAVQGWDTNVTEGTYVVWFRNTVEEDRERYLAQNPDHKLPVLVFYFGDVIKSTEPLLTIYVVIWEDGTLVWGSSKECRSVIRGWIENNEQEIKYFISQIDRGKVNELLFVLADSTVLLDDLIVLIGGGHTHLRFRGKEKLYHVDVDGVYALPLHSSFAGGGISSVKSALVWRRMVNKIFNLIPSKSRPVNISYSRYDCDDPYSWIGIIEIPKE